MEAAFRESLSGDLWITSPPMPHRPPDEVVLQVRAGVAPPPWGDFDGQCGGHGAEDEQTTWSWHYG
jgi:hypothetical protein